MEDTSFTLGRETLQRWALGEPAEVTGRRLECALRVIGVLMKVQGEQQIHSLADEDLYLYQQLGNVSDVVGYFLENSHEHGRTSHLESLVGYIRYHDIRRSWEFLSRLKDHPACTDDVLARAVVYGWYGGVIKTHMLPLNRLVKESGLQVRIAALLAMEGQGSALGTHSYVIEVARRAVELGELGAEAFFRLFVDLTDDEWKPEGHYSSALSLPLPMARVNRAMDLARELVLTP